MSGRSDIIVENEGIRELLDTGFSSIAEATVNLLPITEALRQDPPGDTRAVPIEHRLHEQAVIRRGCALRTRKAREDVLDLVPLIVAQSVMAYGSASAI